MVQKTVLQNLQVRIFNRKKFHVELLAVAPLIYLKAVNACHQDQLNNNVEMLQSL